MNRQTFSLLRLLLMLPLLLVSLCSVVDAQQSRSLLKNGGFEGGDGTTLPGWEPFESGYEVDRQTVHHGTQSLRCDSLSATLKRGGKVTLTLNQTHPLPVAVTGWSKAESVSGVKNNDYAIYIDLEYTDGTPLWGSVAPFGTGTHDWERRQVLILPTKPIKTMTIIALFRNHVGTAWFDDFFAQELSGANLFDSQSLPPMPARPSGGKATLHVTAKDGLSLGFTPLGDLTEVHSGGQDVSGALAGGFYVRDVAEEGPLVPIRTLARSAPDGVRVEGTTSQRIRFSAKITPEGDSLLVDGEITDATNTDRAVTVYLALPIQAEGWQWGQDIRHSETIQREREYSHQVRVNVGATGGLSLYPFGCVSNGQQGIGIASQMDWPSVYRIFYQGTNRWLVMAWDFALTSKTAAWPSHNARFRCHLFRIS